MTSRWTAVLARLGMPTGDGRLLAPGGISNRDLPLPLMWQDRTSDGHGGSFTVGRIESIEYLPDMVVATGSMLDTPEAKQAMSMIEAGVTGPSVDLDDIDYQMDDQERIIVTAGRIAGATLVPIPAFAEVSISLAAGTLVAAVRTSGWADMPISDATSWDGDAAAGRVASWAGVDADDATAEDWNKYARAFLLKRDDADPMTRGAYGFGIADVTDGQLQINPAGVAAAAGAVQGARGGANISDAEASSMRTALSGIYKRMDKTAPWDDDSVTASAAPALPPLAWFTNPGLAQPTPITITEDGRVFGHVAPWGVCHVGAPGCVTAPYSQTDYAYFLVGAQETADGVTVPVGKLTVGGGHADADAGFVAAAEHYDNAGSAVATVFAGEDEHGIWVAGSMLPGVSDEKRAEFLRSPLSGDWRRIGGNLELVAAHAVNVPGFPIPRARVKFALGEQRSLLAHFTITETPEPAPDYTNEAKAASARLAWNLRKGR